MKNHSEPLWRRFPSLGRLALGSTRRRIPVVRQLAVTDCGASALAMVLGYHGRQVAMDDLRRDLGPGRDGSTAASLLRVARAYGLQGRGVRLEIEDLQDLPAGAILYWEFQHFIVFERLRRHRVDVVDPAQGRRPVPISNSLHSSTAAPLIFHPTQPFP